MNKTLLQIPGIEIEDVIQGPGWPALLFKNVSENFRTILKWHIYDLNEYSFWVRVSEKIKTLLYNRVKFEDRIYLTENEVISFIDKNFQKYTPQEKLNMVLEYIAGLTTYDGEAIDIDIETEIRKTEIWRKFYFNNEEEYMFYIENLNEQGLISYEETDTHFLNLKLTLNGLTLVLKINEQKTSRYCFVAMSFDKALEEVYDNGILPALNETGFNPIIVRNEHVDSEKTINDAIIAGIKKARFTIADFTQHRAGVYFEAGYALGRGQKVIYTCRSDEISKAHFDTRNFQHIVWQNSNDLKQKLIDKIAAFILD